VTVKGLYDDCPSCGQTQKEQFDVDEIKGKTFIYNCQSCGAIFGECNLKYSLKIITDDLAMNEFKPNQVKYFEFACCTGGRIKIRNGFFDPISKKRVEI